MIKFVLVSLVLVYVGFTGWTVKHCMISKSAAFDIISEK